MYIDENDENVYQCGITFILHAEAIHLWQGQRVAGRSRENGWE